MSESFFPGTEANVQAIANVLQTTSTYSDSQNHISGHRIVLPLANTQVEERNVDSLCGSPIVFSSTLRSFYNKVNNVDSRSAEESCKESDHDQAGLRTSKIEWVEQYQLGVFITLTVLPSGKKGLKRVRFRYISFHKLYDTENFPPFLQFWFEQRSWLLTNLKEGSLTL